MAQKFRRRNKQTQDDHVRQPARSESQNEQVKNLAQAANLISGRPLLGGQRSVTMRHVNQTQGNRFAQMLVKQRQQAAIMRSDISGYEGQEKEIIDVNTINIEPNIGGGDSGHITVTLLSGRASIDIKQVFINGERVDLAPGKQMGANEARVAVPAEHFNDIREIIVYFKGAEGATPAGGGPGADGAGDDGTDGSDPEPRVEGDLDAGNDPAPQNESGNKIVGDDDGDQGLADQVADVSKMTRDDLINHIETRRDELDIPSGSITNSQFKKASDDGLRVLLKSLYVAEAGNEEQEDIVIEIAQRLVNASNAQETAALKSRQTMQGALDVLRE